jgi:pimeloyl-ACP methyl ester carboxylesterase
MPRRFYLFIGGIHQQPDGRDDWVDRACEWVEDHSTDAARCYEYRCRWWQKTLGQKKRVEACAEILNAYADHERVIVGHSNGCAITLDLLKRYPRLNVHALHLFAAAAPASFHANGLNAAFERGQLGRVYLYGSSSDKALWLGGASRFLLGWAGYGYGDLGRVGPRNCAVRPPRIRTDWRDDFGHSDWFYPQHFDATMRCVTRR